MKKLISIVASAYNEEACVEELCLRLTSVFESQENYNFEAIIVDNGSADQTLSKLNTQRKIYLIGKLETINFCRIVNQQIFLS